MQQCCYRYTALDAQHATIDPAQVPVLVVNATRYRASDVQQNLVDYL